MPFFHLISLPLRERRDKNQFSHTHTDNPGWHLINRFPSENGTLPLVQMKTESSTTLVSKIEEGNATRES